MEVGRKIKEYLSLDDVKRQYLEFVRQFYNEKLFEKESVMLDFLESRLTRKDG